MYKHRHTTKTNLLTVKLSERVEKEFLMMNTNEIPNGNNGTNSRSKRSPFERRIL